MTQYHVGRDGTQFGPYEEAQARELFMQGKITRTDLVWCEGMSGWRPAGEIFGTDVSTSPPTIEVVSPGSNQEIPPTTFASRVDAVKQINTDNQQATSEQDILKARVNGLADLIRLIRNWSILPISLKIALGALMLIAAIFPFALYLQFAPMFSIKSSIKTSGETHESSASPQASVQSNRQMLIQRVRNGAGPYCSGVATNLEQSMEWGDRTGDYGRFNEILGKAQRFNCL